MRAPQTQSRSNPIAERIAAARRRRADGNQPELTGETGGPFPLSTSQEAFWHIEEMHGRSSRNNRPFVVHLTGPLDHDALQAALDALVARHEALRTTISVIDGHVWQQVQPPGPMSLSVEDLCHLQPALRDSTRHRRMTEFTREVLDLGVAPVVRALLLRMAQEDHVLILNLHHLMFDRHSANVMQRDLVELYTAVSQGRPPDLKPLTIQYRDLVAYQTSPTGQKQLEKSVAYWTEHLTGLQGAPALPFDRIPTEDEMMDDGEAGIVEVTVAPDLLVKLRALAQAQGVTLFGLLMAGFQALLYRYTRRDDLAVTASFSVRNWREMGDLVGLFVNTLPVRSRPTGDLAFRTYLQQMRGPLGGAMSHSHTTAIQIGRHLDAQSWAALGVCYNVLFQFSSRHDQPELRRSGALGFAPYWDMDPELGGYLALDITERDDDLVVDLLYRESLFEEATAQRIVEQFLQVLQAVAHDPDLALDDLPVLTPDEARQVLQDWQGAVTGRPARCLHDLFTEQVQANPAAVAVRDQCAQLSYAELDARANQLAHHLRTLQVGPGRFVGVAIPRSLDQIVTLFAILKAGGVYVAVDPRYPKPHISHILDDTGLDLIVANQESAGLLPPHAARLLLWEDLTGILGDYPVTAPAVNVMPGDPVNILYTSGSTGKPKGVVTSHGALANYIESAAAIFALSPSDRMLQFSSISFDTACEEIFTTLATGATLVLPAETTFDTVPTFLRWCKAEGITVLDLPTAYWHQLVTTFAEDDLTLPDPVRLTIIGGERAHPEHFRSWMARVGKRVRLLNTYGPTEATVVSSISDLSAVADQVLAGRELPIGQPIPDTTLFVLDDQHRPLPVNIEGELYIGGLGLADGYLNQPEMTAERFIEVRVGDRVHRLYRTGDRAAFATDGNLHYRGRVDFQVKIRGIRVEPGMIEDTLRRHHQVDEAVVVARPDAAGDIYLTAYFTAAGQLTVNIPDLRRYLTDRLMVWMVPAYFVQMDAFPLTVNGKVDRRALPEPTLSRRDLSSEFVSPQSETERKVAAIWGECLHVGSVGAEDNFFEMGGHSLIATQVIARAQEHLHVPVTVRQLFEGPTVRQFARVIDSLAWLQHDVDAAGAGVYEEGVL